MDCQRAVGKSQKAVPEQTAGQALAAYGAQKERFTAAQAFDFFQVEAVGEVKETNRKHSAQTNNQACLHAPRKRRADGCDWRHPGHTAVGQVQPGGKPENPPDVVGTAQADACLQGGMQVVLQKERYTSQKCLRCDRLNKPSGREYHCRA